jgi:hypothetical protein
MVDTDKREMLSLTYVLEAAPDDISRTKGKNKDKTASIKFSLPNS